MRILLFEWLTGGGLWADHDSPDPLSSVQNQGIAMLTAFASDLAQGHEVIVPVDQRLNFGEFAKSEVIPIDSPESLERTLREQARLADAIMLIAPESNGCLEKCCFELRQFQAKLISPQLDFIRLTADKNASAEWLAPRGVSIPRGQSLTDFGNAARNSVELPLVLKPINGAGSEQVELIEEWDSFCPPRQPDRWRIESYVPGTSVSVSALCGPRETKLLHPTGQVFDRSPFGNYIGGIFPLDPDIAGRASELAERTVEALPQTRGYIGIDMLISFDSRSQDCVVDINPRLTTSYLKLREVHPENLAIETLRIARG